MRHAALAGAVLLSACASWTRPLDPSSVGLRESDVLVVEQEILRDAAAYGRRVTMRSADRVENLRCNTLHGGSPETPRCSYRLFYTDLGGQPRARTRKNWFFARDVNGRWESVIVVTGS